MIRPSALFLETFQNWAFRPQIATALVPHYAPCHHNAIGPCALCQGPCESCGAQDGKAKHFPVSPRRDVDGYLECAECLLPAGHLEFEPVQDLAFFDNQGRAVSGRFDRDGEL